MDMFTGVKIIYDTAILEINKRKEVIKARRLNATVYKVETLIRNIILGSFPPVRKPHFFILNKNDVNEGFNADVSAHLSHLLCSRL